LFISYKETIKKLGTELWETPLGTVISGMEHAQQFYSYGDMPPWGKGPQQGEIKKQGAEYINENFPLTDRFETCTVQRIGHWQNNHQQEQQHESSSLSVRINPEKLLQSSQQYDGSTISYQFGGKRDAQTVLIVVLLVCIGLLMALRSRRKTLNKTS
jgi:lipopolysaccharide export LptBFGC system permease protein LptF